MARSPEVVTACVLGAAAVGLWLGAGHMLAELAALAADLLRVPGGAPVTAASAAAVAERSAGALARALAPLFLAAVCGAVAGSAVQVGFFVSARAVTPDAERIDPFRGLRALLSGAKLVELLRDAAKVAAIGWMGFLAVRPRLPQLPFWSDLPPRELLAQLLLLALGIVKYVLTAYALVALLDYGFRRLQYERRLRMSRREVADEQRETEGDPAVRSRARTLRRELARRRMMDRVAESDVVVTGPAHFAVALRYDRSGGEAPRVVAKGADVVAERITRAAREHRVPLYEDAAAARTLYRGVDVGEAVPPELFPVVAAVLARIYRAGGRRPAIF